MIKKENLSDERSYESGAEEPVQSTSFVKFKAKQSAIPKCTSASAITKNICREMTYLHKKDEEKVDKYRYMTLDQDRKRREDIGRYEAPCTSTPGVYEQPATQERHPVLGALPNAENLMATDNQYDDVLMQSENSSDPGSGGYKEPDVVNSERPVPGRSRFQRVTSATGETSDHQTLR